jgi:uncharacterized protein (DUF1501 family)
MDRRGFMRAVAASGTVLALGSGRPLVAGAVSADDYRALVCVFLAGGNDSFNMLVPRSATEYQLYAQSRQNLKLALDTLIPIEPTVPDASGLRLGLHPSMPELAELFGRDEVCALVAGIGPLVEPVTKQAYLERAARLPPQLFSHNDQQDQWHSLRGVSGLRTGWAGRMADVLLAEGMTQTIAMNVSLAGQTLFQAGVDSVPYTMGPDGPAAFLGLEEDTESSLARRAAFERLARAGDATVYGGAMAKVQLRALDVSRRIGTALANVPKSFQTTFPQTQLGKQLATVAAMIAARNELQVSRQIFFVSTDGFDTHDHQLREQPRLLANLSQCLFAFYRATVEMGVASAVTTFTESEFGRTLTSNGDGTDHGWAGVQMVIGQSVRGRQVFGQYPLLQVGGPDDAGGGRMIPTLSTFQYAATLGRWFGVPESELARVAPGLGNFTAGQADFLLAPT